MIAILDYKAGNQTSVQRALNALEVDNTVTADPKVLAHAYGVIFPGVGAAGQAMAELTSTGLDKVLKEHVQAGRPLLGICVGCQILLAYCEENKTKALEIIPGQCRLFNPGWEDEQGLPLRVPHMGWNTVTLKNPAELLFADIDPRSEFYFVHSYYPAPEERYVLGTTQYGEDFCSFHGRQGLWAVQFHPEKSGRPGLQLLKNFSTYCQEAGNAE